MHIICLTPLEDGVYNDHNSDNILTPPEGWAYIPENLEKPATFPRLSSLEAEKLLYVYFAEVERNGKTVVEQRETLIMTVTAMTEGTLPEPDPEPITPDSTADEVLDALLGV